MAGDADGVDAVAGADLGDGVGQVVAHGCGDRESWPAISSVGMPVSAARSTSASRAVSGLAARLQRGRDELGIEHPLAPGDPADAVGQGLGRRVLEEEAAHMRP